LVSTVVAPAVMGWPVSSRAPGKASTSELGAAVAWDAVAWDAASMAEIVEQAARTDAAIKAAGVTGIMACRGPRGTPAAELERLKTMEQLVNWIRENEAALRENPPPSVTDPH